MWWFLISCCHLVHKWWDFDKNKQQDLIKSTPGMFYTLTFCMLHTVWIWTTICPILTKSNLHCRQAQLSSDLSNIFIYFRSNLLNNNATLCWSLLFPYRYVSNDNCLGRQPLLRTWWNTKMIRQTILVNRNTFQNQEYNSYI